MSFVGVSKTGGRIEGIAHLRQSVETILTTPIGSRVLRRDFGSRLPDLIDQNITPSWKMRLYAAVVDALSKWEPRLKVTRVLTEDTARNAVSLVIEGVYLPDGRPVTLEGIQL